MNATQMTATARDVQANMSSNAKTLADMGEKAIGTVVDGRLVTGVRASGFQPVAEVCSFDVGFEISGLTEGRPVWLEFMQGLAFRNGRGPNPRLQCSQQTVELNFGSDTGDVRIGAAKNVGAE